MAIPGGLACSGQVWNVYAKNGERRNVQINKLLTEPLGVVRMTRLAMDYAFCDQHDGLYGSFRTAFEHAVRKVSLVDVTFHDLRHTLASRLVMSGIDLPH